MCSYMAVWFSKWSRANTTNLLIESDKEYIVLLSFWLTICQLEIQNARLVDWLKELQLNT